MPVFRGFCGGSRRVKGKRHVWRSFFASLFAAGRSDCDQAAKMGCAQRFRWRMRDCRSWCWRVSGSGSSACWPHRPRRLRTTRAPGPGRFSDGFCISPRARIGDLRGPRGDPRAFKDPQAAAFGGFPGPCASVFVAGLWRPDAGAVARGCGPSAVGVDDGDASSAGLGAGSGRSVAVLDPVGDAGLLRRHRVFVGGLAPKEK